jgi:hypothetical protein
MLKYLLFSIVTVSLLGGCSSTPQAEQPIGQYCYTEESIVDTDGVVSSETRVECSDKPKVNHVTRSAGVAQQCREYVHTIQVRGVNKNVKGFLCKFPGGRWEPVNNVYAY